MRGKAGREGRGERLEGRKKTGEPSEVRLPGFFTFTSRNPRGGLLRSASIG